MKINCTQICGRLVHWRNNCIHNANSTCEIHTQKKTNPTGVNCPPLANSDHSGLLVSYSIIQHACSSSVSHLVWDYKKANFSKACVMLDCFDWDSVFEHDVNACAVKWQNVFLDIMSQCIPQHTLHGHRSVPWLILKLIRDRNFLFIKALNPVYIILLWWLTTKDSKTVLSVLYMMQRSVIFCS